MADRASTRSFVCARGAVLLEVVLALTLFVIAAMVILGAVNTSFDVAGSLERRAQAVDRAVTILSLLQAEQIDLNDPDAAGGEFDPPFEDWSYALEVDEPLDALEGPVMQTITITVTHRPDQYRYALTQMFAAPGEGDENVEIVEEDPF